MVKSNIKNLMEAQGITYTTMEKATGFSSQTITRARGDMINECRLSTLIIIAKVLGVSVCELFEEVE